MPTDITTDNNAYRWEVLKKAVNEDSISSHFEIIYKGPREEDALDAAKLAARQNSIVQINLMCLGKRP